MINGLEYGVPLSLPLLLDRLRLSALGVCQIKTHLSNDHSRHSCFPTPEFDWALVSAELLLTGKDTLFRCHCSSTWTGYNANALGSCFTELACLLRMPCVVCPPLAVSHLRHRAVIITLQFINALD